MPSSVEMRLRNESISLALDFNIGATYTADMVKAGVIAIDVGITRTAKGLQGDVHPDVADVASAIAPMPGGVGPMTIASLMMNTLKAMELKGK